LTVDEIKTNSLWITWRKKRVLTGENVEKCGIEKNNLSTAGFG